MLTCSSCEGMNNLCQRDPLLAPPGAKLFVVSLWHLPSLDLFLHLEIFSLCLVYTVLSLFPVISLSNSLLIFSNLFVSVIFFLYLFPSLSSVLHLEIPTTLKTLRTPYFWLNLKCISPALTSPSHSSAYISNSVLELLT